MPLWLIITLIVIVFIFLMYVIIRLGGPSDAVGDFFESAGDCIGDIDFGGGGGDAGGGGD